MAFLLLISGAVLLIAGVRNTQNCLFQLLQADFTGPNNFVYWFLAILILGAIGYIQALKPLSIGLLALVILVLVIKKGNPSGVGGGFFAELLQQVNTTETSSASTGAVSSVLSTIPPLSATPSGAGPTLQPLPGNTNPFVGI